MWKWFQAARGIRYRKHASRKHGAWLDRYLVIRHSVDGTQIDEPLGWGSDGWTVERVKAELSRLQEAKRTGKGPTMLRAEAEANREAEQRRAEEEAAEARRQKTVADLWDRYSKEVMAIENRPRTLPPYPTPSAARLFSLPVNSLSRRATFGSITHSRADFRLPSREAPSAFLNMSCSNR